MKPLVFVTGDTHGEYDRIMDLCDEMDTSKDDIIVVLGDHGVNHIGERESRGFKRLLSRLPITFVFVRGNHDRRPSPASYTLEHIERKDILGDFYAEYDFPSLLHAVDGGVYTFGGKKCMTIGGAFSVDGEYRRRRGMIWFPDEQLTREEFDECLAMYDRIPKDEPLTVLAHTCPLAKIPVEAFMPGVDQNMVDRSMETWFDEIYSQMKPEDRWLCGHYHIDKLDDNVRFMFNDIIEL